MGVPLFRAESQAARHTAWLGRIVLIRPLSFTFLTGCAVAMAGAIVAFLVAGEYTRKARVAGVLAPGEGVVRILAPQSGLVEAVFVAEGEEVARDAPLLALVDARANRGGEGVGRAVAARLDERHRALEQQRRHTSAAMRAELAAFSARRAGIERELAQAEREIGTQAARTALSHAGLDRARRLADIGFLSSAAVDRDRDAALEHAAREASLRRSRLALQRELGTLGDDARAAAARWEAQLAAIEMQRAALEQERVEHELLYRAAIAAPGAGTIATLLVEPGQTVLAGTPLATLIPARSTLEAHLFAPSRSIGFVHVGQPVLLRYVAYPHQKFGIHRARVAGVSRNPMLPGELGFTPPDGTREPLYRIKAVLDAQSVLAYGRAEPLQAGMQIEADILLDRRRLIEWVFEPLLSLAGRA